MSSLPLIARNKKFWRAFDENRHAPYSLRDYGCGILRSF